MFGRKYSFLVNNRKYKTWSKNKMQICHAHFTLCIVSYGKLHLHHASVCIFVFPCLINETFLKAPIFIFKSWWTETGRKQKFYWSAGGLRGAGSLPTRSKGGPPENFSRVWLPQYLEFALSTPKFQSIKYMNSSLKC